MVGLGEQNAEILAVLRDLRAHGVEIVTLGQYLSEPGGAEPVDRYLTPAAFDALAAEARARLDGVRRRLRALVVQRARGLRVREPALTDGAQHRARGSRRSRACCWSCELPGLREPRRGVGGARPAAGGAPRDDRLARRSPRLSDRGCLGDRPALLDGARDFPVREDPRVIAVLITLALCFAFAVFPLLFGWATGRLVAAFGTRGLLEGAPFLWVASELLRPRTYFEFPWCLLGYGRRPFTPVIQLASVTAVYGMSSCWSRLSTLLAMASWRRACDARLSPAWRRWWRSPGGSEPMRSAGRCARRAAYRCIVRGRPAGGRSTSRPRTPGATWAATSS